MKRITGFSLFLQVFLLWSLNVMAQFQPAEVVRSQEKTMINGRIYYIHTIQKGQTLYSICKVYGVTQDEVLKENPEVDPASIKEGLAIRIPETGPKVAPVYPENRNDYQAHTVKKGQTVYSLSKKYNVSEEVIYHYNPWAREGIKIDQTIWIPRKKELLDISDEARSNDLFFYYTVKEKDTLYAISELYGVTVPDLINANPELRNGLKYGQVLKIPKIKTPEPEDAVTETVEDLVFPCRPVSESATYNVVLMLPFFAEFNMEEVTMPVDTLAEEGTYVPVQRQQGLRGRSFAEFYEGFMLAVDSLKSTGLSLNLIVKDTERDTLRMKKIVRELSVVQPDLIIGPVYSEDVNITGRLARYQEINLISPLSTRHQLVAGNTSIIQVIPTRQAESLALANYLKNITKGRIILIRGTDSSSITNSWHFKKFILENTPHDSLGNDLDFKDYRLNDSLMLVLEKVLTRQNDNIIVVFSDNEPEVSRLVTRLNLLSSLYPLQLYGMSSWQTWKTIHLDDFHNLQLYLITPFFIDHNNPMVRRFLLKSRDAYGYEPFEISPLGYNFSMLGYDIGLYFLSALHQYGRNFQQCLDQYVSYQLMTNYRFIKQGTGGYANNSFVLIQYKKDFTVQKVALIGEGQAY